MTRADCDRIDLTAGRKFTIWSICFLISLMASLWGSYDCPLTHAAFEKIDSNWFYICGEWLMRGFTPYVDFTDSKGPLVWLFYGVGNLLDPDGWWGVFWLYVLVYSFSCYWCWRIVLEVTDGNRALALACTLLMPVVLFWLVHCENRCENMAQPVELYLLYLTILTLRGKPMQAGRWIWTGVGLGTLLFIKWTFPVYFLPFPIIMLWLGSKRKVGLLRTKACGYFCIGFLLPLVLVCAWMTAQGTLLPMYSEYFSATTSTYDVSVKKVVADWCTFVFYPNKFYWRLNCYYIVYLVGVVLFCLRFLGKKGMWIMAGIDVWMFILVHVHPMAHYLEILQPLAILGIIWVLAEVWPHRRPWLGVALAFCLGAAGVVIRDYRIRTRDGQGRINPERQEVQRILSSFQGKKILYFGNYDGMFLGLNPMPATKYVFTQSGASEQMKEQQLECMKTRTADIIFLGRWPKVSVPDPDPTEYGYSLIREIGASSYYLHFKVYMKEELADSLTAAGHSLSEK